MSFFTSIHQVLLLFILSLFISPINAMEQMDDEARDNYTIEWLKVEPF